MIRHLLQAALPAAAIALLLTLQTALAQTPPRTAEAYLAVGDYAGARDALARLVAGRPDAALHAAHLEGLILMHQGRLAEAAALFREILALAPAYVPARRSLTMVLANTGDIGAAAWHAERLLAADPGGRERAALEQLVTQARAGSARGVALRFALLPSSNASRGTEAETIMIDGLPFVIDPGSRARGGTGLSFGLSAWSGRRIGPDWTATLGAFADLKLYETDIADEANLGLALDLARGTPRARLSFGPRAEMRLLDGSEDRRRLGFGIAGGWRAGQRGEVSVSASLWRQWYPDACFRNGTLVEGSLGYRHVLSPTTAVIVTLPFERERTGRAHLDHDELGVAVGLEHEWRGGLIIGLSASWRQDDYLGTYPGTIVSRSDEVSTIGLALRHRKLRIGRFLPEVSYTYTRANSNIPFHAYEAHDVGLALSTRF